VGALLLALQIPRPFESIINIYPGSAFIEQSWLLQSICPTFWTSDDVVTTRHLRQRWLTVVVKLYPLEPTPLNLSRNLQMPKGNRGSAIRHNRGNH
jgi:hypothetical protein